MTIKTSVCVHCSKHVLQFLGDKKWHQEHGLPGVTQYCWIDELQGSQLHEPRLGAVREVPDYDQK